MAPQVAGAGVLPTMIATPPIRPLHTNESTPAPPKAPRGRMNGSSQAPSSGPQSTNSLTMPLSARKAQPLDLASVERRGQPTASREPIKLSRPFGILEAPTFRPTTEEFRDPIEYIKKIGIEGRKYGIAKIIPPDSWNPNFAIDTERFHFRTRRQELNSVEGATRTSLNYLDQLSKYHKQNGINLVRFPSVDKRPLDLYKLKRAVEMRGGFEKVCKQKKWAEIGRDLGYSGKIMSSLSTSLKNSYQKWLHPYEEYLKIAKPGVYQQLEMENGGPYTPSPGPSPLKKPSHQNTPSSLGGDSPAVRASTALNATLQDVPIPKLEPSRETLRETPRPPPSSGFTAVNHSGGFTAVNASSGFSAINAPGAQPSMTSFQAVHHPSSSSFSAINTLNGHHRESDNSTPIRSVESPLTSANGTPDLRPSAFANGTPIANGQGIHRIKRQNSIGTPENGASNGDGDASGRRSKRLRKDAAPTVAGSHMTQPRLPTPRLYAPKDRSKEKPGDKCETCGKDDEPTAILLCDSCDAGYHRYCLEPPLKATPDYDWHCPRCLVGTGEFGFEEGGVYSLKQFQEKANNFKENYFLPRMPFDPVLNCKRPVTEEDVEKEFWRLVESITETVEVEYGADIHSTTHGSGFPTQEKCPRDPYANDPWNLNVLPLHPESLFKHIKSDISGMTVPWLYVGMCFSTFCWHSEDHNTYSTNYQHFGATKTWYGIPSEDAEKFENAMREAVPELFETQPDLLFQLVTLLTPEQLKKAGVRVYALDQRAGQFVVTFPEAYHAGFNHGFNFNEAVNFAPRDWEPYGETGVQKLQAFRRQPCFSHDELLLTAAQREGNSIKSAKWLSPPLKRLLERELKVRDEFFNKQKEHEQMWLNSDVTHDNKPDLTGELDEGDLVDDDYICAYCKCYAYLSRYVCYKSEKTICLHHAGTFECCEDDETGRFLGLNGSHSLHLRMTDEQLSDSVQKVIDKAQAPELWEEKLEKLLEEEPKPQLKALKSLLSEGEKIQWDIPTLPELKKYVDRCTEWVEDAQNYITRKQQNRRKNERIWRKSNNAAKAAEMEERDREFRKVENIKRLLALADEISFDCPEIQTLRERADNITEFQKNAQNALANYGLRTVKEMDELVDVGKSFNVDIPEVEQLDKLVQQLKWIELARERRNGPPMTLQEVSEFIRKGLDLGIPETDQFISFFKEQEEQGKLWEAKAKELMAVENVHYQQLDALSNQASAFPVTPETLAAVDAILKKQRDVQEQIVALYEKSKHPDLKQRPKYKEVREAMDVLLQLNTKPPGTLDLEKEQKRHEDWMRRGKKLFGKANAPLHILHSHMQAVESRNEACFDLNDQPRMPVEPASREHTPVDPQEVEGSGSSRDVFCICRRPEAGMMIECELCHEWYHGKCLKIARGKVKEDDKYTCPICDYRVKIPRDAARPKLEDLQLWQDEIPGLPFQPEEEETLSNIIDHAQTFRDFMKTVIKDDPLLSTPDDLTTQRFYLRKIEGADILLAFETNFFRQELHKWAPVAPEPPPKLEVSLSTRKPRPTKVQKLMAQLGVQNPEDLPPHLRTKSISGRRKQSERLTMTPKTLDDRSHTPPGLPPNMQQHQPTVDPFGIPTTSVPDVGPSNHHPRAFVFSTSTEPPMFSQNTNPFSPSFSAVSPPTATMTVAAMDSRLDPAMFDQSRSEDREMRDFFNSSGGSGGDGVFGDLGGGMGMGDSHAEDALAMTGTTGTGEDGEDGGIGEFLNQ
ncbi:PLU-1-domain-containing protein [Patellaria atrata CBS 101060]|uniref:PLU-1-domain-containing protein n=1 Tax=Patellaria atrata CBS 101060 TaxID=1346257 RepID=A0A9P4VPV4_9PEZI|nr:PLU-1-domain-containing protein [Patellaria atrata CBS 101060]